MKSYWTVVLSASVLGLRALSLLVAPGNRVLAQGGQTIGGALGGFQEVPVISTTGTGTFVAAIPTGDTQINYTLTYSSLSSAATMAHIHLGQRGVNGGIVAFLCGGGNKPACPATGSVSGTITAADIQAVASQGIAAGELTEVLAAIRAGVTYANVHSTTFGSGEIRGQIRVF